MKKVKRYNIGRITPSSEYNFKFTLLPKRVVTPERNHIVFEWGYYWLFFYLYKRRKCTRCGVISCRMGLIPYYSDIKTKDKIIAWFCPACGKPVLDIRLKASKKCNYCHYRKKGCDGGSGRLVSQF